MGGLTEMESRGCESIFYGHGNDLWLTMESGGCDFRSRRATNTSSFICTTLCYINKVSNGDIFAILLTMLAHVIMIYNFADETWIWINDYTESG